MWSTNEHRTAEIKWKKSLPSRAWSIKHMWICDDLGFPCAQWLIEFETEAVKCWNRMIYVKDIFGLWFIQLQREEKKSLPYQDWDNRQFLTMGSPSYNRPVY